MDKNFWKSVFCDADGVGSFGRVASFMVICFSCIWISYLLLKITTSVDFVQLNPIAVFIASVTGFITAIYGMTKINETLQNKDKP